MKKYNNKGNVRGVTTRRRSCTYICHN